MKPHTKAEDKHLDKVAQLNCAVCTRLGFGTPCQQVHHIIVCGRRKGHGLVIPLCFEHHQGQMGIHGMGKSGFESYYKFDEFDLLNDTIIRLAHT